MDIVGYLPLQLHPEQTMTVEEIEIGEPFYTIEQSLCMRVSYQGDHGLCRFVNLSNGQIDYSSPDLVVYPADGVHIEEN